jgi:hypothetical protein
MRSLWLIVVGCGGAAVPDEVGCGPDALSTCAAPTQDPTWYAEQGRIYFDTLDASASRDSVPEYAEGVARWEWPPWLLLTGYGREQIEAVDRVVLLADDTVTVPVRDCRAFDVQPFGRCRVVMDYAGKPCPIYEEFTFNDAGEMTFIEAWSDLPGLRPAEGDDWAEGPNIGRLSTRVPGFGSATGALDLDSDAMAAAAADDPDVADFVRRARDFWGTWTETYIAAGPDLYPRGCGWE